MASSNWLSNGVSITPSGDEVRARATEGLAGLVPVIEPFSEDDDVVNLGVFDLSVVSNSTDALGGNDFVVLSNTQNVGLPFTGGDGQDTIGGSNVGDIIKGGRGDDTLEGNSGNDRLEGEGDNDLLRGGAGEDTLFGGGGRDELFGGSQNDKLFGNSGMDMLFGDEGHDILRGQGDDDQLFGGQGNDSLNGGAGNDVIRGGTNNDRLNGGVGNDQLFGDDGIDNLNGGAGTDVLSGGAGFDNLTGGADSDIFLALGNDIGIEAVRDFTNGEDFLQLAGVTARNGDVISGFEVLDTNANGFLDGGDEDIIEAGGDTVLRIYLANDSQIRLFGVQGGTLSAEDLIITGAIA